ncbi:exo-alpha-sialidase [bacterium]|nr:exo-alpha-sialidase [bacterium]
MLIGAPKAARGNKAKATRALGISERLMGLRVGKHEIEPKRYKWAGPLYPDQGTPAMKTTLALLLLLAFARCATKALGQDEPALKPPRILRPVPKEYADEARIFQGIPSMTQSPGGRLWANWYTGGPSECHLNYVLLASSDDRGETWTKPILAIDPDGAGPIRAYDPAMWTDPKGAVWLFWAQGGSWWDGRAGTWAMTCTNPDDPDPAWSDPRRLFDGIMMCRPTVDAQGRWLFPASIWQVKPNSAPELRQDMGEMKGANIFASTDQGKTFSHLGQARTPQKSATFDEHMIVQRKDGSLWMLLRTKYGIGEATSTDGGKTFTPVTPSAIKHTSARFFVRRLLSGALLLVKHGLKVEEKIGRSHLTAFVSDDDGKTWKGGLLLDERNGVSYPDGRQNPDGAIYIIYDYSRTDSMKILMARFTEDDVRARKVVSGGSKLRLLVNQATGVGKPKLEFEPKANDDGAVLAKGPAAQITPAAGSVDTFKAGTVLFTDRDYRAWDPPRELKGKRMLRDSIDRSSFTCTAPGVAYVLTPAKDRNRDSMADPLVKQGFEKVKMGEFLLFGNIPGNIVTVYQKRLAKGETIAFGKWGVVVW